MIPFEFYQYSPWPRQRQYNLYCLQSKFISIIDNNGIKYFFIIKIRKTKILEQVTLGILKC